MIRLQPNKETEAALKCTLLFFLLKIDQRPLDLPIEIGKGDQRDIDNNTAVRDMLVSRDIYPEQLPPAEDVKMVERRLVKDNKTLI
jgi:hypothetical protein